MCRITAQFLLIIITFSFSQNFWEQTNGPVGATVNSLLTIKSNGNIFAGVGSSGSSVMGVFRSTDNGLNWTQTSLNNVIVMALISDSSGRLYAGTYGNGVYRSLNNGSSWTQSLNLTNLYVHCLAIDSDGSLLAGIDNYGGIIRSIDNGVNWSLCGNTGSSSTGNYDVYALALDSTGFSIAGTYGGGLFRAEAYRCSTWTNINTGLVGQHVYALVTDKYGNIFAGTDSGICRSTNNGLNWTKLIRIGYGLRCLAIDTGNTIYAGTGGGVFRSTNIDSVWTRINTGLSNQYVNSLSINSSNRIFAGTAGSGVFRSTLPAPPPTPVLSAPANAAPNIPLTPTLTWVPSVGASTYRVQLSTSATFASFVVDDSTLATTSQAVGPLATNTTYYWRVNGKNTVGTSGYSTVWNFTTLPAAPTAPILSSPDNTALNITLNPYLSWSISSGATTYRIQLSTSATFTSFVVNDSTLSTTVRSVGPLVANTVYYWRVNAKNAGGTSAYSLIWSFTTLPAPPAAPALSFPANSSTNIALSPALTWGASAGATTYRVQLSTNATFAIYVIDDSTLTTTSRAIGPLSTYSTYFWRINAKNIAGTSAWSSVWSFVTLPSIPNQVLLLSPSSQSVIKIDSVVFLWNKSASGVDKYCLELFTDSLLTNRLLIDSTITDTVKIRKNLQTGTSYWWRVKAHNISGWGNVSELRKISVDLPVVALIPSKFTCILNGVSSTGSIVKYGLPSISNVSIRLYNIQGKLLQIICNTNQQAGYYQISINQPLLSKGCYLLDFRAGNFKAKRILNHF